MKNPQNYSDASAMTISPGKWALPLDQSPRRPSAGATLLLFIAAFSAAAAASLNAQVSPAASDAPKNEQTVVLNPFVVSADQPDQYAATDTLAGNRVRTNLSDVGSAVQVLTKKFLDDTNSKNQADLLVLTTSTEVGGQGGNFVGQGNGPSIAGTPPLVPVTRIRGLDAADLTQDFFLTRIPFDSYNTSRVDIQRGPNAILFGIGSPGGIINGTTNEAIFKNSNKIENQVASFGSLRFSADFNRVLLPNELAIRVSWLNDDTKYRQAPAFKDDHRQFGSLKWDPAFLNKGSAHTSISFHVEHGQIRGEAPMETPPLDRITPYFNYGEFRNGDGSLKTYDGRTASSNFGILGPLADNKWLQSGFSFNNTTFEASGAQGTAFYGSGFQWPDIHVTNDQFPAAVTGNFISVVGYNTYATSSGLLGSGLGALKEKSLTDPTIFDFYKNLIYGPNAGEDDNFTSETANISQTFFNNKVGFNLSYNHQSSLFAGYSLGATALSIDVTSVYASGLPNPNVGRPFVQGNAGGYWSDETRETRRLNGFAELNASDFLNKDSLLTRVLGRHVFTGLIDRYERREDNRNYNSNIIAFDANNWQSLNPANDATSLDENAVIYLGPKLNGLNAASGTNVSRISGTINYLPTTMPEWNNVTQTLVNAPITVINNQAQANSAKTYSAGNLSESITNSKALTWQGYFFDGTVVGLWGYRKDSQSAYTQTAPTIPGSHWVNTLSSVYALPSAPTATTSGHSNTYSVVLHLPEKIRQKLPGRINVSPFFNQSANFQPSAGRIDFNGNPLASPSGKTREFGVTVSALEDKVTLRVTRFKTNSSNVSLPFDNGTVLFGMTVPYAWGQSEYYAITHPELNVPFGFLRNSQGTTSSGQTIWLKPPGSAPWTQAQVDAEYTAQQATIAAWKTDFQLSPALQKVWNMTNYNDPATYASAFTGNANLAITGDTFAKGTEVELQANPIRGLTVAFNVSHTDTVQDNIASTFYDFYQHEKTILDGPAGDMPVFGSGQTPTARSWFHDYATPQINLFLASLGSAVPELRPWRFNATADYSFSTGVLKGAHVGGSYRWQGENIIGYPVITVDGVETYDVAHPYHGSTIGTTDAWIGYSRKISKSFTWRTQLNVRNVFATNKLSRVTVQPDGSGAAYRIPEPRVISWTNSLEF